MILVTGFGPFLDVEDNPSGRLARACHGLRVRGETVIGRVVDASYVGGIQETIRVARAHSPRLVLGTGLSRRERVSRFERFAYSDYSASLLDSDGQVAKAPSGPHRVAATVDVEGLA